MNPPDARVRLWLGPGFGDGTGGLRFEHPRTVLRCDHPDDLDACLSALQTATQNGLWAAGFFSYELGYLLEARLRSLLPRQRSAPLLWFALFDRPAGTDPDGRPPPTPEGCGAWALTDLDTGWDQPTYGERFGRVRSFIEAGDVYQLNLTFKLRGRLAGDRRAAFRDLYARQPVRFAAHLEAPDFDLLSLSPELFFRSDGRSIAVRPMKGTASRHADAQADAAAAAWLRTDPKSRAENLMIVDLLRNDLGRIAEIGTVRVTDLFTVETYPTVHQMTSSVRARLCAETDLRTLLHGLFPCGSVTGAPKIRAMELIRSLEDDGRGVYTGALGLIRPGGDACFNVAIRTLFVDAEGRADFGLGSGLVFESEAEAEYAECRLKARFVEDALPDLHLLETLRWDPEHGFVLLDRHLDRLAASARAFGIGLDRSGLTRALQAAVRDPATGAPTAPMRVRLLVARDGGWRVTATPLPAEDAPGTVLRALLADQPVHSADPFLYHKTTRRDLYDRTFARLNAATGCDEVLFVNERGELCEGSRTNLFLARAGRLLTPPVSSGLLPGTLRAHLFATLPPGAIAEAVLTPADLEAEGTRLLLGNSVRGLQPAILIDGGTGASL